MFSWFVSVRRVIWKTGILTALTSLLVFTIAGAAPSDLDTTFDGDGLVTTNIVPSNPGRHDIGEGVAVQANGKIVVAGWSFVEATNTQDFALAYYNPNGSLDNNFSGDGRLITNFGGKDAAFAVAVQSNGKIIAAGERCNPNTLLCDAVLARYNTDGTLDTSFSGDGKQITDLGGRNNGSLGGLAIQSDGKIVVAGYVDNNTNRDYAVYRYKAICPDDSHCLDTTFSQDMDGVAIGHFGLGRQDIVVDLGIQSNGKIVIAGYTGDANGNNNNFAIARLNGNGTADTTFSGDGWQTTNFGADEFGLAVAIQPDGKIIVVGEKDIPTPPFTFFAIARYNINGGLDTTFNGTGKKVFSIRAGEFSAAYDVIPANNKIVVLGHSNIDFALVRLNSGGTFDAFFSGDGKVTIDFGSGSSSVGRALALQPSDGKYVLAGNFVDANGRDFALARVLP